jgi:hypothetical protein
VDVAQQLLEVVEIVERIDAGRGAAPAGLGRGCGAHHAFGRGLLVDQVELVFDRHDGREFHVGERLHGAGEDVARIGEPRRAVLVVHGGEHLAGRAQAPRHRLQVPLTGKQK